MTDTERYEKYNLMRKLCVGYETAIRAKMKDEGKTVYTCYLSVADEENELFFVDIEIGGSEKTYRHVKGNFKDIQIIKLFF